MEGVEPSCHSRPTCGLRCGRAVTSPSLENFELTNLLAKRLSDVWHDWLMTDFNDLTREQQDALIKADKSFKASDTLTNFGNGIFFVSIALPILVAIQATSDGDDDRLILAFGWFIGAAISAGLLRALTIVIANLSDMKAHTIRMEVGHQSGWTAGD